ncbi:N-acetylmuramoyl-L-alanine amidase [Anaerosalibacter massiliensis]|uniref:N-acetylmuramoyl-L-alanine amidase n=1 Tax=Anaerosalibacter massiliensis TaxID=1347392 RepID=A0A9X2MKN1_9FIRM|nr:N-acetylmuramoyl-L-alanine amidase [Anaerosalibacter massiliensis]MCR2045474.1 N-acetylmuramoyl-L-alanine amidase [Anaerosalibacter massiliensis]
MNKLIAVDNGHGINTPGKRTPKMSNGRVIKEWEFNYPTAKKLGEVLRYNGFRVLYVSDTEEDTPLNTRTSRANNANADLFISIHYNAFQSVWGSHGGIETLYHPSSSNGKKLASLMQNELIKETGLRNRGIKERPNLAVLKNTRMPSTLAECGFMDNLEEANLMLDKNYQWKCAKAIAKGVCKYFGVTYKDLGTETTPPTSGGNDTSTILKIGSRGTEVRYLQMNLNGLGYKGVSIDGIYGAGTADAVRRFQAAYGLSADGIAGPNTLNKMDSIIRGLQSNLNKLGYNVGSIDGVFGNSTKNAVIAFQRDNGLTADGIPGKNTFAKIEEVIKNKDSDKNRLYRVQVGAFGVRDNAQKLVDELRCKGYDAIIVQDGGLYKVQTGAFSKRENADNLVAQLKKDGFEAIVI